MDEEPVFLCCAKKLDEGKMAHTHTQKDTNREGGDTRGTGREEGKKESLEL